MRLTLNQSIQSPGQVLMDNYLRAQKISISEFSKMSGVPMRMLSSIIRGARMPHSVINRISATTRTAPRYWHYIQAIWEFHRYLRFRKPMHRIEPISLRWRKDAFESPGQILYREFIRPSGKSFRLIERQYKIDLPLHYIVKGKRSITPLMASGLQSAFGVNTRYWLDLQIYYELTKMLEVELKNNKSTTAKALINFRSVLEQRKFLINEIKTQPIHPGKILFNKFVRPSGITINEWAKIFFMQTKEFKQIISGKKGLSPKMVIKLSRIFNTDISYWIDLNNKYFTQWANTQYLKIASNKKIQKDSVSVKYIATPPFEFLEDNFLRPMDFPLKTFLRHIGIKRSYGDDLRVIPRVNFEAIIRISQALKIEPQFLLFLQLEYSIQLNENGMLTKPTSIS